jgi:hypothetical protein
VDDQSLQTPGSGKPHLNRAGTNWLRALKVYLAVTAVANLIWEMLQLPLYTIWTTGTPRELTFAVIHCTGGDVVIALTTLTLTLIAVGTKPWPAESHRLVMLGTVSMGLGYTIFSEWLNIVARKSWAYSPLMPVVPGINTGLSPLLQWIIVPALALVWARKAALGRAMRP